MPYDLFREDLHRVLARTPRAVRNLLREHPEKLLLAGGYIRAVIGNERPNDIDIFCSSKELALQAAQGLALAYKGRLHSTDNAHTVLASGRVPVQFIHRWTYATPAELLEDFDFTIAQAVIYATPDENTLEWQSQVAFSFYADLAAKRLVYTAPVRDEEPGGSLMRVRKFLARGYHIDATNLGLVITRLVLGVDQIRDLGIGQAHLARVITGLLREVDPLLVIDGIEAEEEKEE